MSFFYSFSKIQFFNCRNTKIKERERKKEKNTKNAKGSKVFILRLVVRVKKKGVLTSKENLIEIGINFLGLF